MERLQGAPQEISGDARTVPSANRVLQEQWEGALRTDEYEVAAKNLEEVSEFRKWREAAKRSPFPQFYKFIEGVTLANKSGASQVERAEIADKLVVQSRALSPRSRDLYLSLLSDLDGMSYSPEFEMTKRQHEALKDSGDLALLQDPSIPWNLKLNRMQTRIENELKGRKALDRRDKEQADAEQEERQLSDQHTLPQDSDEHESTMDETSRLKEGEEAQALATISPGYGGYWREKSFDSWNPDTNRWYQSVYQFERVNLPIVARSSAGQLVQLQVQPQEWTRIPMSDNFEIEGAAGVTGAIVQRDQNGDYRLRSYLGGAVDLSLKKLDDKKQRQEQPVTAPSIPADFTEETEAKLVEIESSRHGNVERARALAAYTIRHLNYSNDSSYNQIYKTHPHGKIGGIDREKQADCDVAADYFAALCSRLHIPVRLVRGHMVKGKDAEGNSRITSGTGHAWNEVWDESGKEWVRIDATPPGDPQFEEDQQQGEAVPGDYGEQEAIGPTDEELHELAEKLSQHTEELSYTREERELSKATGIELKEARHIVKEMNEAENTRLPNGDRVSDVMAQMWELIRDSRKTKSPVYTGPLRKREGGEGIDDIIAHKIGIQTGDSDPISREKEHEQEVIEQIIHKMMVLIVGDKSGSMNDMVDGVTKWKMQRLGMYLVLSSLYRAEQNMQRSAKMMSEPLSLESEMISFRGSSEIDIDKPLSAQFSLVDKVNLWRSLGNQGSGNGDVAALTYFRDEIRQDTRKDVLRVLIACSDGMPDDVAGVHRLAEELGEMNTVVVGVGMTETATQVPVIFNTAYSKGDFAKNMNDLPAILAKHVILEAVKLFPQKTKENYQRSIDILLAKFDRVGVR